MAYAKLGNAKVGPAFDGGTSASADTTGANLLVFFVSSYQGATAPTVLDSKGNTWNGLTAYTSGNSRGQLFWCIPTSVGSGHTFTLTGTGVACTGYVIFFSGAASATPADQSSVGTSFTTSVQPGSITPTQDGELCVTWTVEGNDGTVGDSYTRVYQDNAGGSGFPAAIAFKIQTTATATNPTWTVTNSGNEVRAYVASFKAAAAAAGGFFARPYYDMLIG